MSQFRSLFLLVAVLFAMSITIACSEQTAQKPAPPPDTRNADEAAIRAAHKRLMELIHPDRNGSAWLSHKVQQARDTLLAPSSQEWLRSHPRSAASRNRSANR